MGVQDIWFSLLVGLSFLTSLLSAVAGAGGGAVLIAALASVLPAHAIIPVHGFVQMGSNVGRSALTWRHIDWPTVIWFVPFGLIGTLLGSLILLQLPQHWLQLSIAGFLLFLTWGPQLPKLILGRVGLALGAALCGFISLFVGASGPVVASFVKARFDHRHTVVATFAAIMTMQHAPKAFVFGAQGFVFEQWWLLIMCMIAAGFLGTYMGVRWLKRMTNRHFDQLFKWVITLLALRLLWTAF